MANEDFKAQVEARAKTANIPFQWLADGNAMVINPSQSQAFADIVNECSQSGEFKAQVTNEFINQRDNNGGINNDSPMDNGNSGYSVTTNPDD